jgi:hypothetical protein
MRQVAFEPTIPVLERAKTVHALDRAATVIGKLYLYIFIYLFKDTINNSDYDVDISLLNFLC